MANFTKAAATAKRLVEANGRRVELFRSNRTPDDTTKPWRGTSEQPHVSEGGAGFPVVMAFVPASGGGFGKLLRDLAGSLQVTFEQMGLLASDSIPSGYTFQDVEQADRVRDGDDIWRIVVREHLRPASKSVLFMVGLAR